MKLLKKLWAKICGLTKYLVYMGKVIQTLKIVAGLMPQIAMMVKPEQQKAFGKLAEVLQNITGKLETTEKYLNEMGVQTTVEALQRKAGEKLTLPRGVKMLKQIDSELPDAVEDEEVEFEIEFEK